MNVCTNCKYYRYMFRDHYCVSPNFFKESDMSISRITGKHECKNEDFPTMLCYKVRNYEGDNCIHFANRVPILKRILNIKPFRALRNICKMVRCFILFKEYKKDD